MSTPKTVTADFYIVLEPVRGWWGEKKIESIRARILRANKPTIPKGHVAVHLRLNFDRDALEDSIPVVEMNVSSFGVSAPEPEVVAA